MKTVLVSALGKGEVWSSILHCSTTTPLGVLRFLRQRADSYSAAIGRTWREQTRGIRGKAVETVPGWFGGAA